MPATMRSSERAAHEEENDQDAPPDSEDAEAEGGEPEAEEREAVGVEPAQPWLQPWGTRYSNPSYPGVPARARPPPVAVAVTA